jgi:hypothetical protein
MLVLRFIKVGTNRVNGIAENVVKPTHTAFMPDKHILEGVVILHETIHDFIGRRWMDYFFKYISKQLMIKLIGISYNKRCA